MTCKNCQNSTRSSCSYCEITPVLDTPSGVPEAFDYEKVSHSHCWESENPPCGIKGKHRCCLCKEPVPKVREEELIKEFKDHCKSYESYDTEANADRIVDWFLDKLTQRTAEIEKEIEGLRLPKDGNYYQYETYNKALDTVLVALRKFY